MIGQPNGWIEVPVHVCRDRTLTPAERSVLLCVVSRLGGAAAAVIEVATVADDLGLAVPIVRKAVGVLSGRGLVHVSQQCPGEPLTFSLGPAWLPQRVAL